MSAASTFRVADEVFDAFPDYIVGWVTASFSTADIVTGKVEDLLRGAEERARTIHAGRDLKEAPTIAAWRSAFSNRGWSASKFPSSVEALTKRVLRGVLLPSIHPAVDLVNAASLTYQVPIGCHDVSTIDVLEVRPATAEDSYLPMGDGDAETPDEGEFIYVNGHQVRTRRWVWRQSRDALVSASATHLFFPVDGFEDITRPNVDAAVEFLRNTLSDEFGATVASGVVHRANAVVSLAKPTG